MNPLEMTPGQHYQYRCNDRTWSMPHLFERCGDAHVDMRHTPSLPPWQPTFATMKSLIWRACCQHGFGPEEACHGIGCNRNSVAKERLTPRITIRRDPPTNPADFWRVARDAGITTAEQLRERLDGDAAHWFNKYDRAVKERDEAREKLAALEEHALEVQGIDEDMHCMRLRAKKAEAECERLRRGKVSLLDLDQGSDPGQSILDAISRGLQSGVITLLDLDEIADRHSGFVTKDDVGETGPSAAAKAPPVQRGAQVRVQSMWEE